MDLSVLAFLFVFEIVKWLIISTIFIVICRMMARQKGLPDTWMWFGLLGIIGIIVVALKKPVKSASTYNQSGNYYQGGYVQNGQNSQNVQYSQYNPDMQAQGQQGYNLNGQYYNGTAGTICSFCGMKVSSDVKECPMCGSRVN